MCTIFVVSQMKTSRFGDVVYYQDVEFKRTERIEERRKRLSMKWVVVTDKLGKRRLQMRWTVARSSVPPTFRSATEHLSNLRWAGAAIQLPARSHE